MAITNNREKYIQKNQINNSKKKEKHKIWKMVETTV